MSNGYRNGTRTVYQAGFEIAGAKHWQDALYSSEESAERAGRDSARARGCGDAATVITKSIEIYR